MKNLPIGLQSIERIRAKDCIYVDKTQFALELIKGGASHYFLSRPRRFGKSLFVSTLEEIFKGNKALFEGCHIAQSGHDWQPHPVLLFDFGAIANKTPEKLEINLQELITNLSKEQGIKVDGTSLELRLEVLVKALASKGRVVMLIDEYDKPIIDNLHNLEVAEGNRQLLQAFFGVLKSLDKYIQFTFITGISRFSKVSLFSQANHLKDISMDARYAAMMGYTQEEIGQYFSEHMQAITQERNQKGQPSTQEEVLAEIKDWYNGYCFSSEKIYVYNPFSTLNYLDEKQPSSYWYATGTPTFLIKQMKDHPSNLVPLSGITADKDELTSSGSIEEVELKALMFQTGYLTIEAYNETTKYYQLGFPNQEVREAFTKSLVKHFAKLDAELSAEVKAILEQQELAKFFKEIQEILASFPYQIFSNAQERTYQGFVLSILKGMRINVAAEIPSSLGCLDLLVQVSKTTYVIEVKLDLSPEEGLKQIKKQQYHRPYLGQGKAIAIVGLSFSSKKRNIATWQGELLDEHGELIRKLAPAAKQ